MLILDTKDPEMRLGLFKNDSVQFVEGNKFILCNDDILDDKTQASVSHKLLYTEVKVGDNKEIFLQKGIHRKNSQMDAIAHATVQLGYELNASAIITPTRSGYTTRVISKYKPKAPVIAFTQTSQVARHLNLRWGVYPIPCATWLDIVQMIDYSSSATLEKEYVKKGDLIILTAVMKYGEGGTRAC